MFNRKRYGKIWQCSKDKKQVLGECVGDGI
jgi:hypothetical protein